MTDPEKEKITVALANEFLNSFNINGLVAAAKHYSIHLAQEKIDSSSEDELKNIMAEVLKREKEAAEQAAKVDQPTETLERAVTDVNPES